MMKVIEDKRGFIDTEILLSPGFVILAILAWSATIAGWVMSRNAGWEAFSIPNLLILLGVELVACYIFAARM